MNGLQDIERKTRTASIARLAGRHKPYLFEALPWLLIIAAYFLFPGYLVLGTQVLIWILFALSLDLLLGYAGIVTLGHAVFFGLGAYSAGVLSVHLTAEPLTGLLSALVVCGAFGLLTGAIVLTTSGLTFLMLTLTISLLVGEFANRASSLTGGADGLQGVSVDPLFSLFRFDMFGRTAYIYAAVVLLVYFLLVRTLIYSPFGRSLEGIRENAGRMEALGSPVRKRLIAVYGISAAIAGCAGALNTQATQFASLSSLSFETSGAVLTMLILGGTGRLYGAFIGAPIYLVMQDYMARLDPAYWFFWIGIFLIFIVMFGRGGIIGLVQNLWSGLRARRQ